jgi:hypothetical protein
MKPFWHAKNFQKQNGIWQSPPLLYTWIKLLLDHEICVLLLATLRLPLKYQLLQNLLLSYCMLFSQLPFGSLGIWSQCNFASFTDLAISSFFKPWLKQALQYCLHCLWRKFDIFSNGFWTFIDVHILTQVLQSPKPEISTYSHQGNSEWYENTTPTQFHVFRKQNHHSYRYHN